MHNTLFRICFFFCFCVCRQFLKSILCCFFFSLYFHLVHGELILGITINGKCVDGWIPKEKKNEEIYLCPHYRFQYNQNKLFCSSVKGSKWFKCKRARFTWAKEQTRRKRTQKQTSMWNKRLIIIKAMPNMRSIFDFYCVSSGWYSQFGDMKTVHSSLSMRQEPLSMITTQMGPN